jgi:hypothetical protein
MHLRLAKLGSMMALTAGIVLMALPAGVAAASPTTAATPAETPIVVTPPACVDGHWPASVQGRPLLFHAGARAGDYIWHDATGWHLRVTHQGKAGVVFTGKIVSAAPLDEVPVRLEPQDVVTLSADKKTITYRFVNYGGVDGFDFRASCSSRLAFTGRMAGLRLPDWRIRLGLHSRHPLENPFVIRRIA